MVLCEASLCCSVTSCVNENEDMTTLIADVRGRTARGRVQTGQVHDRSERGGEEERKERGEEQTEKQRQE